MGKNQHYVPKLYIRRFGYGKVDKPKISVLDKEMKLVRYDQNPDNFATERYFYNVPRSVIDNALRNDLKAFPSIKDSKYYHDKELVENSLSRVESEYKKLLYILENNPYLIYEDKYRARFICFVHELAYRTKSFRDEMERINKGLREVLSEACDNIGLTEEQKRITLDKNCISGVDMQIEKVLSIVPVLETKELLIDYYDWFIGINKTKYGFIISDNPAKTVWLRFNDICIPVSRNLAIIMRTKDKNSPIISCDKENGKIINMSIRGVEIYNSMQIDMAQRYLFGAKEDIDFIKNKVC